MVGIRFSFNIRIGWVRIGFQVRVWGTYIKKYLLDELLIAWATQPVTSTWTLICNPSLSNVCLTWRWEPANEENREDGKVSEWCDSFVTFTTYSQDTFQVSNSEVLLAKKMMTSSHNTFPPPSGVFRRCCVFVQLGAAVPAASTADVVLVKLHKRGVWAKTFYCSETFSSSADDPHKAKQACLLNSSVSCRNHLCKQWYVFGFMFFIRRVGFIVSDDSLNHWIMSDEGPSLQRFPL